MLLHALCLYTKVLTFCRVLYPFCKTKTRRRQQEYVTNIGYALKAKNERNH